MKENIVIDHDAATFARSTLLEWHKKATRSFPWRHDSDPYRVLMAEMMLRRTQARQVVPVYRNFIIQYPDAISLDQAPTEEVIAVLHPLGLGWRAANFKKLASELVIRHGGRVPKERSSLLALTGVGPYIAEAVRCFAFDEQATIVDTNTVRVAARYFGFQYNPESRRRKAVINAVSHLVDQHEPVCSNYALLDFAAIICQSHNPNHNDCPIAARCDYYRHLLDNQSQPN